MHTGLSLHVYDGTQANASAVLVEDMVTESPSIGYIVSVLLHHLPLTGMLLRTLWRVPMESTNGWLGQAQCGWGI